MSPEHQALVYLLSWVIGIPAMIAGVLVLAHDWQWRRARNLGALRQWLCSHPNVDYVHLAPSPIGGGMALSVSFNRCRRCRKEGV